MQILLVGAGKIARHYLKVIESLGHTGIVVSRGRENVDSLKLEFPKTQVFSGGLESWLAGNTPPKYTIIATPIDHLARATRELLLSGCTNLLVEKPLSYSIEEANNLLKLAKLKGAQVFVAFNRRSYVSVTKARELIKADGGVSSFHFDFSEASFRIDPSKYSNETNKKWGIANSSHVIETAFYLGGNPEWLQSRQYPGPPSWHPAGSIFTGMGETINGIPFTYHANWGCPGKWNIEIMTSERKLLFSPMERLQQQLKGSFKIELVELDYSIDVDFKPGFYLQVQSFLSDATHLFSLEELAQNIQLMKTIFNYS